MLVSFLAFLKLLLSFVSVVSLPSSAYQAFISIFMLIRSAGFFIPLTAFGICIVILFNVSLIIFIIDLVLFIARKIPMANIN